MHYAYRGRVVSTKSKTGNIQQNKINTIGCKHNAIPLENLVEDCRVNQKKSFLVVYVGQHNGTKIL